MKLCRFITIGLTFFALLNSLMASEEQAQRAELRQALSFEAAYTGDYVSVLDGGIEKKSLYLGNLDLVVNVDFETLVGWSGFTANLYILGNHGDDPTEFVGDSMVSSNIESPEDYIKVYEAWIQQDFEDYFSLLLGMHDLNSEFYVTDSSGLFLNSNFGIGVDLAQTGANGPSIFPQTAPAIRVALRPLDSFELRLAAYNGRAGNPDSVKQSYARYDSDDGLLTIAEATYFLSEQGKLAFGSWSYSEDVDKIDGSGATKNMGSYVLGDYAWSQGLSLFIRYGMANEEVNAIESSLATGVLVRQLVASRPDDSFGLAYTKASPSSELGGAFVAEEVFELTYEAILSENLSLQPDLQLIKKPGLAKEADDALVFALRLGLML